MKQIHAQSCELGPCPEVKKSKLDTDCLLIINEIYRKNVQLKIGLNSIQIYFFKCKNLVDKTFLFLENLAYKFGFCYSISSFLMTVTFTWGL